MSQHPITHPLAAVRAQHGWTLQNVADIVQDRSGLNMAAQRKKIGRWEREAVVPEIPAQLALADELGIGHDVVHRDGWPGWLLHAAAPTEPLDSIWTPDQAGIVLDSVVDSALMDRRGFLVMTGSTAAGIAITWATTPPAGATPAAAGGRITDQAIGHLRKRVEELWHLDDALGGGGCLDAGAADLRLTCTLIRRGQYSSTVGRELWSLAAALGRFCGWAAFDARRHAAAQRFWHAALRASAVSGDRDQGVYALSNLALQAAYAGDGGTCLALLDVARDRVDPAARTVLAMLDCWAARGHAAAGDARAAAAALNRADTLYERRVDGADPAWIYWMPQPTQTAEAASAFLAIGDHAAAERALVGGMDAVADAGPRDHVLYLARLVEVQHAANRLDEATATARTAIEESVGVVSDRVQHCVDTAIEAMPTREPAVRQLLDYRRELAAA